MTPALSQTILIVDDDGRSRKLLELLLKADGYHTSTAANGEDALTSINSSPPDLILLDVMMPGINGHQLAGILKARADVSNIPIIMVTAGKRAESRLAGLTAGAEEFLTKPINRAELCLRVRNLLRLKLLGDIQKQSQEEILALNASLEAKVRQRTAELMHANEELESFSYSVSHDLRSPLISMDGFVSLLDKDLDSGGASVRAKHYLGRIRNSALQMGNLIDALLRLAQVSRVPLCNSRVDLSAMACCILNSFRESEPDRVVAVTIQPELWVDGDPTLLRLVMVNLLSNAWKFTSKQPQSSISFYCKTDGEGKPVYAVRDSGAGFSMGYADKLFGPFQRLHNAAEFQGTGIGLATVNRIVARHGGRVWAESAPDQGATFYFTLGS